MSFSNLSDFPVQNSIVGYLIESLLLQILLHRKRISSFFLGLQSQFFNSHDHRNHETQTKNIFFEPSVNQENKLDDQSILCSGEVEIVLRSLGIFSHGDEAKIPARLNAQEIFNIFEEKNPSLDEVREAFDVFDSNRDGYIDEVELQKVLCALGLKEGLKMEKCRRMIGVFDEDGDGRINFDEFVKFMEKSFN